MIDGNTLVETSRAKVGESVVVSIDGHGGSGKSTLAQTLARQLQASIVQTDDFASPDSHHDWSARLIDSVIKPIEAGASELSYERSKWWPTHQPAPVVNKRVSRIMILEGTGSSRKALRPYLGFSIFVDTPAEICMQRGIDRDTAAGVGSDAEIRQCWLNWIENDLAYFEREAPRQYADMVVDGSIVMAQA